jgi:hypothetical protein
MVQSTSGAIYKGVQSLFTIQSFADTKALALAIDSAANEGEKQAAITAFANSFFNIVLTGILDF